MDVAARKRKNRTSLRNKGEQCNVEQEILPDTIAGILRRMQEEFKCPICLGTMMGPVSTGCNHTFCSQCILQALDRRDGCPLCKTHVTKRSLNRVDHLEKLIYAFLELKDVYELESGTTLSQTRRVYETEPQENLTQLFPYPEKNEDPSSSTSEGQQPAVVSPKPTSTGDTPEITALGNTCAGDTSTAKSNTINAQDALGMDTDLECFDEDLDEMSASQAAQLAEKMISLMSLAEPSDPAPILSSPTPTQSLISGIQCDLRPELTKIKLEDMDECIVDQSKRSIQARPKLSALNAGSLPVVTADQKALEDIFGPTQEAPSRETDMILCGTLMSATKKQQMENIAKTLKTKTTDDTATQPTHIVMDITREQSESGSGRTVKYFLGVLRSCWVLRYEWINVSMNAGYWVDEFPYQVYDNEFGCNAPKLSRASLLRGEPKLFAGYEVQLFGTFIKPTKEEIELMVRAGGGTVVPQLFLRDTRSAKSYTLAMDDQEENYRVRHIILYDQASEGVVSLKKLKTEVRSMRELAKSLGKRVEVVQRNILLDCIAQYDMDKLIESSIT
ncbi:hypothetical protein EDD21DRAFT_362228 [Dissophora ornata]|nr:hypothetical protein EDD21DRAFT_362228 [Dissophora ornata]